MIWDQVFHDHNSVSSAQPQRSGPSLGPHFFCIGPGCSATTWIADHLKLQRDVWLPPIQELGYLHGGFQRFLGTPHLRLEWDAWSITKRIVRNKSLSLRPDLQFLEHAKALADVPDTTRDLDAYRKLFEPAAGKITGDITPNYADLSVDEIRSFAPVLDDAQIFMIARDPVQRFWSAVATFWRHRVWDDFDYGSLDGAMNLFESEHHQKQHLLSQIVHRWRTGIGEERLKIFMFDDLATNPKATLKDIVSYIGADYRKRIAIVSPALNRKARDPRPDISQDAREAVREAFQPELERCAELFGSYGEQWLERHRRPYN
ncbi:MAG TPA: sulfotransferase [Sphingomicrobium sp.]